MTFEKRSGERKMTLILGLGNRARHGKDTFASAIDHYCYLAYAAAIKHKLSNYKPVIVQRLAFADPLYQEVNNFLGSNPGKRWLAGEKERTQDFLLLAIPDWVQPTPNAEVGSRAPYGKHAKLLQWWGTEYRRNQDPEYWIKQWKAAINPKANIVLAPDMRFSNEAQAIKNEGGFTIQINRKNQDGTPFVDPSRPSNHISEISLDGYNYDFQITVKTGEQVLLEEWAITLIQYLRALKGHK
jgi:hypothetical protein